MGRKKMTSRKAAEIEAWRTRTRDREAQKIAAEKARLARLPVPK